MKVEIKDRKKIYHCGKQVKKETKKQDKKEVKKENLDV